MHMHDESIAELEKTLISVPAGGPIVYPAIANPALLINHTINCELVSH